MSGRLVLGLLLTLAVLPAQTTTRLTTRPVGTRHPFLWRIEGKGDKTFEKQSWLYGTMHQGDERLVALPDSVQRARESADALYFEVDRDQDAKQVQTWWEKNLILPRQQTLRDRLPKKLYNRLSDYFLKRGVRIRDICRLQVWAVTLWLDKVNGDHEKMTRRLDQMLYEDAKAAGKEVGGLETTAEQLGTRAELPEEDLIQMLDASLAYLEKLDAKGIAPQRMLLDAYLTGDGSKIMALIHDAYGEGTDMLQRFMKPSMKRNIRMADRVARMMAKHPQKSYFFAVGVLHCPYESGIVDLLRKKGYRITRIGAPKKKKLRRRWL